MADDLVIGGQLGNYLIESVVGRGGMSVVYRARHSRLGTSAALKVLAPELSSDDTFRERFLREAQMAAGIDHPNVIPIHDMGLHDNSLYIVMRYVSGGDLKTLLAEAGALDPQQAIALLRPVAQALDAAHARSLVHRDVKPGNILIQRTGAGAIEHVYLTDFGIAKSVSSVSGLTRAGGVLGTVDYMAPEQTQGREVSAATDVYALACVFYQSVTGQVPFERELARGAWPPMDGALEPISKLRSGLPAELDAVMEKALARDPAARYAGCVQMLDACSEALRAPAHAPSPGLGETVALTAADATAPGAAPPPPAATAGVRDDLATSGGATGAAWPAAAAAQAPSGQTTPPGQAPPPPAQSAPPPPAQTPSGSAPRANGHKRFDRRWGYGAAILVAIAVAVVAIVLASSGSSTPKGAAFNTALGEVPANNVTGSGTASVRLNGNVITVSLTTTGLDYGEQLGHAMHIHAGGKGVCPPASAAVPHNGHLAIDTVDGIKFYGPAKVALTTSGDTSAASILTFARYPTGGDIRYNRTIPIAAEVAKLIRENNAVVIVHGTDYGHEGQYTGVLERSELNPKFPATATAPALCGVLIASKKTSASAAVYTAKLVANPYAAFLCEGSEGIALAPERARATAYVRTRGRHVA
jgi:tRNA A-37 threonylcarbamoyl transferase component Bud32